MRVRQKQRKIQSCVFSKGTGKAGKPERNRERTVKDGATSHGFNVSEPGFLQEWSPQDFPFTESRAGTGGVGGPRVLQLFTQIRCILTTLP